MVSFGTLAAVLALAGPAWSAVALYGVNQNDELITINTSTGVGTLVGPLSTSMSALGLAQTGGKLYAFDTNYPNALQQLNASTAATIATIPLSFTASEVLAEGDLAFRSDGIGFLVSSLLADGSFDPTKGSFFSLDPTAGTRTLILDEFTQKMSGLAFNPVNNNLYGLTADGTGLYQVDPATGAVTLIGTGTGIAGGLCCYGGLAFSSSGTLYGSLSDFDNSILYQLDTVTGLGTSIGIIGFPSISGIAFFDAGDSPSPIPEPSAGSLLLAALGAMAVERKIRREAGRRA